MAAGTGGMVLLLVASLGLLGGAAAGAPTTASASSPSPSVSHTSWAWGAETNLSIALTYAGAYNASATAAPGNLTTAGAFVAYGIALGESYATYTVVNASLTSGGALHLDVTTAEYRGIAVAERISGDLPVAGSYAANATVPLLPQNASLRIVEQVLDVAAASLNYTVNSSGSLALHNEHLRFARFVNLSLDAMHFPNVTANPSGGTTLRYDSGSVSAQGFEGLDLHARFAPGLVLVQRPLGVGNSWNGTTNASWSGTASYGSSTQFSIPNGPSARSTQASSVKFNANTTLMLGARVVATVPVVQLNGSTVREYVINYTLTSSGLGAQVVDGLLLVPSSNATTSSAGLTEAVPERPASAPVAQQTGPSSEALVPASDGLPHGATTTPIAGHPVTSGAMDPNDANAAIAGLRSGSVAPSSGFPMAAFLIAAVAVFAAGAVAIRRELRPKK